MFLTTSPPTLPSTRTLRLSFSDPALRTAIQITLASGIAMILGLMLSRDRWFWAVLSAFLVFTNTRSRGDTALKALQRSAGTLFGLIAGIGLATLISGQMAILAALALVGIFLAFYLLPLSYAAMTFFVSIVLALVYSMMGVLTPQLLQLRLEETLIGTFAGTAVAFLVFPTRTQSTLDVAVDKWFAALATLLDEASANASGQRLLFCSQALDRAYGELAAAAKPLGVSWQMVARPGQIRQTLAVFMACTYWARMFARRFEAVPDGEAEALLSLSKERLEAVRARQAQCFYADRPPPVFLKRHLPLSRKGSNIGISMIGIMLARLYPPPEDLGEPALVR